METKLIAMEIHVVITKADAHDWDTAADAINRIGIILENLEKEGFNIQCID